MSEETLQQDQPEPRGRGRQPYCPDCIKAGRPDVLKGPGLPYCRECMRRRQRVYRTAGVEAIDPVDAREREFRRELDVLRGQLMAARDALKTALRERDELAEDPTGALDEIRRELREVTANRDVWQQYCQEAVQLLRDHDVPLPPWGPFIEPPVQSKVPDLSYMESLILPSDRD